MRRLSSRKRATWASAISARISWSAAKTPYCVRTCALCALRYGDIDELRAEYGEGDVEAVPLPANTTNPSLVLIPHPKTEIMDVTMGEDPSLEYEL